MDTRRRQEIIKCVLEVVTACTSTIPYAFKSVPMILALRIIVGLAHYAPYRIVVTFL